MKQKRIEKIYRECVKSLKTRKLSSSQELLLKEGCKKAIDDNPELPFNDQLFAAKIYLNYIVLFPELEINEQSSKMSDSNIVST